MSGFDAVNCPLQRHRNVPIRDNSGPTASYILAFAGRLLLTEAVEEVGKIRIHATNDRCDRQMHNIDSIAGALLNHYFKKFETGDFFDSLD